MYNIDQYSLREYIITNSGDVSVYYKIDRFVKGDYEEYEEIVEVPAGEKKEIWLTPDGVYRLVVANDIDFNNIANIYIINNITELLARKQQFLTDVLTKHDVKDCSKNRYYDYITFNLLFETYNKLVRDTFISSVIPSNLYKIEYLLGQLKNY